jgi:hypothetical protein
LNQLTATYRIIAASLSAQGGRVEVDMQFEILHEPENLAGTSLNSGAELNPLPRLSKLLEPRAYFGHKFVPEENGQCREGEQNDHGGHEKQP